MWWTRFYDFLPSLQILRFDVDGPFFSFFCKSIFRIYFITPAGFSFMNLHKIRHSTQAQAPSRYNGEDTVTLVYVTKIVRLWYVAGKPHARCLRIIELASSCTWEYALGLAEHAEMTGQNFKHLVVCPGEPTPLLVARSANDPVMRNANALDDYILRPVDRLGGSKGFKGSHGGSRFRLPCTKLDEGFSWTPVTTRMWGSKWN